MAWYVYAIRVLERRDIPAHGTSVDRRTMNLVADMYNDERIRTLVCLCCLQCYVSWNGLDEITYAEALMKSKSPISMISGKYFIDYLIGAHEGNRAQFSFSLYKQRYMTDDSSLSSEQMVLMDVGNGGVSYSIPTACNCQLFVVPRIYAAAVRMCTVQR